MCAHSEKIHVLLYRRDVRSYIRLVVLRPASSQLLCDVASLLGIHIHAYLPRVSGTAYEEIGCITIISKG